VLVLVFQFVLSLVLVLKFSLSLDCMFEDHCELLCQLIAPSAAAPS